MKQAARFMYYIAIVCPPNINEKVLHYKNWMKDQFGCAVALKSPAHITLVPPYWLVESKEEILLQTLGSFKSSAGELKIELDGFSHFGKRVLFIRVKENSILTEVKRQTEIHFMHSFGDVIKTEERNFHPHITIANRDLIPSAFVKAWEYLSAKEFNEVFTAKTISILKLVDRKWKVISQKDWNT